MKKIAASLAVLLMVAVGVAIYLGVRNSQLRAEARDWRGVRQSLRYACMDNYLRGEPSNSKVVLFRKACLQIGIWNGPAAEPAAQEPTR
ncbi:MAG: hypothetical protein HS111_16970 [Kofleriaceae bacterium]|nr:hypothetical protein [Kofleriaceae bacterium]MCL4223137.1 hypothetical protein [Myxococcales bacterium]